MRLLLHSIRTAAASAAITLLVAGAAPAPAAVEAPVGHNHQAVLLADGRVLVVGDGGPQVYDPGPGSWSATKPMVLGRQAFAAARLSDGRVLVTGGVAGADQASTSAEVFDPKTDTWSSVGNMVVGRSFHTATPLADGRVLVAGGQKAGHGPYLGDADIFDPATGTFTLTAAMDQGRSFHSATRLADGRVLVLGGQGDSHGYSLRDAVVYDPNSGTWTVVPQLMAEGRVGHSATLLPDGTVLIAGGTVLRTGGQSDDFRASVEIFRPENEAFTAGPSLSRPMVFHSSALVAGGRVLVADATGAEIYDSVARRWSPAPAPGMADVVSATVLGDGRILLLGEGESGIYGVPHAGDLSSGTKAGEADSRSGSGGSGWIVTGAGLALVAGLLALAAFRRSRKRGVETPGVGEL